MFSHFNSAGKASSSFLIQGACHIASEDKPLPRFKCSVLALNIASGSFIIRTSQRRSSS
jgi:hypothetical protein